MMKKVLSRFLAFALAATVLVTFASCSSNADKNSEEKNGTLIVDSLGNEAYVKKDVRVVSLYGSFAECWQLSGGKLVGVTDDAVKERKMQLDGAEVIGTVKSPNVEKIVELNPDYVIMSADIATQADIKQTLDNAGIAYGYFRVDTFDDYDKMMKSFCDINGNAAAYEENVTGVRANIEAIKNKVASKDGGNILLLRAYSTGVKAKTDDNLAGVILNELGAHNIADKHKSLLEELSVEQIIQENPQQIFVLTMGSEDAAVAYLEENIISNPAWAGIDAVKNNKIHILPKELFHYKPNNRWDESYEYIAKILYENDFE